MHDKGISLKWLDGRGHLKTVSIFSFLEEKTIY